ncbi:MAG: RnfABCDGE type electron transport complex subunit D [Candidatus Kerfeldbacteria bacterium]|nr:RnfABCDGE type electron transport complex subunit D [Candidatus Kerfeldbacteria bacterium]
MHTSFLLAWFRRDVRHQVTLVLVAVWVAAIAHFRDPRTFFVPLATIAVGTIGAAAYFRWRGRPQFPASALVTSLLVGLNLSPWGSVWPILAAAVIGGGSKFLLWPIRRHWFNPAAFGIVLASVLFGLPVAWWAVSWSWIPSAILLIGMVPVLRRLRRLWLPTTFLIVYTSWIGLVVGEIGPVLRQLVDGTVLLFALVMLPEPVTSPANRAWKYVFGALVAGIVITVSVGRKLLPVPIDVFLLSLLSADVIAVLVQTGMNWRAGQALIFEKRRISRSEIRNPKAVGKES